MVSSSSKSHVILAAVCLAIVFATLAHCRELEAFSTEKGQRKLLGKCAVRKNHRCKGSHFLGIIHEEDPCMCIKYCKDDGECDKWYWTKNKCRLYDGRESCREGDGYYTYKD